MVRRRTLGLDCISFEIYTLAMKTALRTKRAQLLKGSQTLEARLKEELKDPAFKAELEKESLEIEVAQQLYAMRERKRLTQTQLAGRAGIKQSNLARIEQGKQNLTLGTIQQLAGAMNCRVKLTLIPA